MEDRPARPGPTTETLSEATVEAVVAQHESALLRYATRFVNDAAAAQDIVQEVFVRLWQHWKEAGGTGPELGFWLYRLTHNVAIDHIRRESRLRKLHTDQRPFVPAVSVHGSAEPAGFEAKKELLFAHLGVLDAAERQVLILRLQNGLSYRDISQVTRRTEGNVGCILHNAVKKLSLSLKKSGVIS